jgi:hypothetical protein
MIESRTEAAAATTMVGHFKLPLGYCLFGIRVAMDGRCKREKERKLKREKNGGWGCVERKRDDIVEDRGWLQQWPRGISVHEENYTKTQGIYRVRHML